MDELDDLIHFEEETDDGRGISCYSQIRIGNLMRILLIRASWIGLNKMHKRPSIEKEENCPSLSSFFLFFLSFFSPTVIVIFPPE